jgi:hypothetical protein
VTGGSRQSKTGATWLSGFPGKDEKSAHAATIQTDIGAERPGTKTQETGFGIHQKEWGAGSTIRERRGFLNQTFVAILAECVVYPDSGCIAYGQNTHT